MKEFTIISVSIDVTKINKDRLKTGKDGKGKYLDITLLESRERKYGNDFMVVEQRTKEERAAAPDVRGTILGNARYLKGGPANPAPARQAAPTPAPSSPIDGDDVPF